MPTTLVWTKGSGRVDRAVDVALGREVDDGADLVLAPAGARPAPRRRCRRGRRRSAGRPGDVGEVGGVAGVGQLVEVDDPPTRRRPLEQELPDEVAADEAAAACDEEVHRRR